MPLDPSTVTVMPSFISAVPTAVPTTQGRRYSRATMAQWLRMPPVSATTAMMGERPMNELNFDEARDQGYAFIGDPDYVLERIKAQMREIGAGVLMGLFQFGSLPHALAKKNVELFAKTVLPELRRA